ncbi:MAG: hypothetical protein IT373_32625 [Polyangiaceae bacterium]|nr:hypothetical protein [Polyangiaceae bacterium]
MKKRARSDGDGTERAEISAPLAPPAALCPARSRGVGAPSCARPFDPSTPEGG